MIRRISKTHEGEDRIHHRWINRRQPFGTLEVLQHPLARTPHRTLTTRFSWKALVQLQDPVESEKRGLPGIKTLSRRGSCNQFIQPSVRRHRPTGLSRVKD